MVEEHIDFKAWDLLNKKMGKVVELTFDLDENGEIELEGRMEGEGVEIGRTYFDADVMVDGKYPEHVILLHVSPVNDKNGDYLYEGAIIKEHPNGYIGVVKKDMGNFFVKWNSGYPDWSWSEMAYDHTQIIEIIGDIYQNPELNPFDE